MSQAQLNLLYEIFTTTGPYSSCFRVIEGKAATMPNIEADHPSQIGVGRLDSHGRTRRLACGAVRLDEALQYTVAEYMELCMS